MNKKPDNSQEVETTGHSWDGIEEYNNPLPRWWVWVFYATIVWGVIYTILYPAWPGINGATPGVLGYSTRAEVAAEIAAVEKANAPMNERLLAADMTEIRSDEELHSFAVNAGNAVFDTWCAQCHGSNGAGATGYPVLGDNDWIWGGRINEIIFTVSHGIRNLDDDLARSPFGNMPAFDYLPEEEIDAVTNYVLSISGQDHDAGLASAGEEVFAMNCVSCHGENGQGSLAAMTREFEDPENPMPDAEVTGAPALNDAIWLYGSGEDSIRETLMNGRAGAMPAWSDRLSEAEIRAVAAYVHQLGGGQ